MVGRTALLTRLSLTGDEGSNPLPSACFLASVVKWKSCLASNGVFWVRILAEVLKSLRKGNPNGDGNRLEAGRAFQCALRVQLPLLPFLKQLDRKIEMTLWS